MNWREVQKRQAQIQPSTNLVALVRGYAVPLIDRDQQRTAALGDHTEETCVLFCHGIVRIDDTNHHVRRVDSLQRLDDAEFLDRFFHSGAPPHTCGVYQGVFTSLALERYEYRIASCAGLIERDQAFFAEQAIDES